MSLNAHRLRAGDLRLNALSQFIIYLFIQCADPGKEFMSSGGGGGGGFQARQPENSLDVFFCFLVLIATYFTVYRGGPMVLLQKKTNLFQGSRGGGGIFSREGEGVQMLIYNW